VILSIDVQYQEDSAYIAGVLFDSWGSEEPSAEYVSYLYNVEEYQPGSFYKRELPCILKLLKEHLVQPNTILIDGYVYLDGTSKAGLGKHLYDALEQKIEIIGIAKKSFFDIDQSHAVYRGISTKPLYITSTGDLENAKHNIVSMFGGSRIPVLLKRADQLCREEAGKSRSGDTWCEC